MPDDTTALSPNPSWIKQHGLKLVALAFWLSMILGYQWYMQRSALAPLEALQRVLDFMTGSLWGPLIYIGLYALRPLILFPSTILTLAGGFVYGPFWGVVFTLIASNISATVAYFIGRYFGKGVLKEGAADSLLQRYTTRLRRNSFETILIMRFIFLPYDLVNYLAGFLRIRWAPFILATILGSIPGTIAFVWAGASIENLENGLPTLNPHTLLASAVILVVSLALSQLFKRRKGDLN